MPTVQQALDGDGDPYPGSGFVLVATALGAVGTARALGMHRHSLCLAVLRKCRHSQAKSLSGNSASP